MKNYVVQVLQDLCALPSVRLELSEPTPRATGGTLTLSENADP